MYGKIFDSIYEGTLYGQWEGIVTLQQLIVLCDLNGAVDMTPEVIAARTSIPIEIISKGIKILSEPDPYSRTPGEGGRRIKLIDEHRPWGWVIVNHAKYQALRNRREKLEADRERIAAKRKSLKNSDVADCRNPSHPVRDVAPASASASASASADATTTALGGESAPPKPPRSDDAARRAPKKRPNGASKTAEVERAYRAAIAEIYHTDPGALNARQRGILAKFVDRVPAEEAPAIVRHYVKSKRGLYNSSGHCLELLLRDAEALRLSWKTGAHRTDTQARLEDRTATRGEVFLKLIDESK